MKRILLLLALSHFATPFLSFSQSTEDFSDETISGVTITTNTGLIISSSNLDWSAYTNQLDYNNVLLSPPSPYITPSSNSDFFQITLSDQSKVFSSIEFDLWLNYGGMFGTGDMGCDCKSYTSENQLIETISKGSNEVAKNFIFNSGSIKKIICNPTNVEGGNNLHVDDIVFTIAQQENNNEILLNGTVSAESNQIKNVADPTETQDVATKNYVDSNVNSFTGSYNDLTDQPSLRDLIGDNPVIFGSLSAFGGTYNNRAILDLVANTEGNLITGYKNGSSGDRFNVKLDNTNGNAVVSSGGGYNLKLYSEGGTIEFEGDAMMSTPSFTFNGAVTATSFAGDGSQLTNLPTSDVSYNDLTDKPTTYTQAQVDALISNLQIDNNFSDVKLIGVSETYIVPSGKSSRISNVLGSTHWRTLGNNDGGLDRKIIVNGATIYIGGTYKQFVNSNDSRLLWTLFTVKGEYWFPSGTTIQIGSSENINYLSIQETDVTNVKSFLITEPSTVPSGKKWKISSVLPSRALYGDADYKIEINSTSVFVGSGQNFTGSYTFGHMIINLIDGPIWLPEGTTVGPSDNIYGVSVVEYSN